MVDPNGIAEGIQSSREDEGKRESSCDQQLLGRSGFGVYRTMDVFLIGVESSRGAKKFAQPAHCRPIPASHFDNVCIKQWGRIFGISCMDLFKKLNREIIALSEDFHTGHQTHRLKSEIELPNMRGIRIPFEI